MADNENDETTADDLIADIDKLEEKAARAKHLGEAKREFTDNVYPMMRKICQVLGGQVLDLEDAMEELAGGAADNTIFPDLAGPLFGLIEIAKQLAAAVLDGRGLDSATKELAKTALETAAILEPMAQEALVVDEETAGEAEQVAEGAPVEASATVVEAQS